MGRRSKKKQKTKPKTIPKTSIKLETDAQPDEIIRLKITLRKGARIESVPIKKLEKIATAKRKNWELKDEWLILNAQG